MGAVGDGWEQATTDTLLETRQRLLGGIRRVYEHMVDGNVHDIHEGHSSSPADAGFVTWILLEGCELELTRREAL